MSGSGSGGFYKYRCKYFYTHNCSNWVYVSNAACATCLVSICHTICPTRFFSSLVFLTHGLAANELLQGQGRDEDKTPAQAQAPSWNAPLKEIYVPFFLDGVLQYSLMQIVPTDPSGLYWELKHKVAHPSIPMVPTTSDQPRAVFAPTAGPTPTQS